MSERAWIDVEIDEMRAEIERLETDKAAISQTASDYLLEIERLRAALGAATSEIVEWRRDIIQAHAAGMADAVRSPHYNEIYQREVARLDALIARCRG